MTSERAIRNLALIGFMGAGKSSAGRLAAATLHFTFLDTDRVIEARAGSTISEVFASQGEPAFREWERRIVEELTRRSKTVIATGGGLPVTEANLLIFPPDRISQGIARGAVIEEYSVGVIGVRLRKRVGVENSRHFRRRPEHNTHLLAGIGK